MIDKTLLQKCYEDFKGKKSDYDKMYSYYKGDTDAMSNYKMVTARNNNKTPVNFLKKFIKEEVSYSVGNEITYISKEANTEIIKDIDYYTSHWSEQHDSNLCKKMLTFSKCYELYYIDKKGFSSKIITPREGYVYVDNVGNISFFMHFFKKRFDDTQYIDIYDNKFIYHLNDSFEEVAPVSTHIFGVVPVGIATLSEEDKDDTLYKDIKGLSDAYETNLSDISNEISDFRNAYLKIMGVELTKEQADSMKENGIIQMNTKDGSVDWLVKNINDTFIQNTLNTIEDKIYQIASHINHNEKIQSNVSGVALRAKLFALENKCGLNQKALTDCIKTRLELLFLYIKTIKNKEYDFRDIEVKFTSNIPQDDNVVANYISILVGAGIISKETARGLLSFINNTANEAEKVANEENEVNTGKTLLDNIGSGN
jgi:SPP1 family phage portal protein